MSSYDETMERAAFDFAWKGYTEAEIEASAAFSSATEYLAINAGASDEGEMYTAASSSATITTQEEHMEFVTVDISEELPDSIRRAVLLGRTATYVTTKDLDGANPRFEMVLADSAIMLDTSFEPPMPTGEEYHRPAVTVVLQEDMVTVEKTHLASPERPASLDDLYAIREDQKRYVAILGMVRSVREQRGEVSAAETE